MQQPEIQEGTEKTNRIT